MKFSKSSARRLATCHPILQNLFTAVLEKQQQDFSVICGYRDRIAQTAAFVEGNSTKEWPNSKHNTSPSRAIDIEPYPSATPLDYYNLFLLVSTTAREMGISIRWGGVFKPTTPLLLPSGKIIPLGWDAGHYELA
jgi:hypothetical protein